MNEPKDVFLGLRDQIFRGAPDQLGPDAGSQTPETLKAELARAELSHHRFIVWQALRRIGAGPGSDEADQVLGAVAELGMSGGSALVVGFRDGAASMYTSSGGGVIGGEGHEVVRAAARNFCETGEKLTAHLHPTAQKPALPSEGEVTYSLLTPNGMRSALALERDLQQPSHPLFPLFKAMHELLTAIRRSDPSTADGDVRGRGESNDERGYVNCALTTVGKNPGRSAFIDAGIDLPNPSAWTRDPEQLEWIASHSFRLSDLDADAVIELILSMTSFGLLGFLKSRGTLEAHLVLPGGSSKDVAFAVERSRGQQGGQRIKITSPRA